MGDPPSTLVVNFINDKKYHDSNTEDNVYKIPPLFADFILSDDMIFILIKLLSKNQDQRFESLDLVKKKLLELKANIESTPEVLR